MPEPPFVPTNFSRQGSAAATRLIGPLFVPLPNSTALGWTSNMTPPAAWPPLSSLRLLVSQEGQSCVDACHSAGFICEPAHFRFINNKEALRGWVRPKYCKVIKQNSIQTRQILFFLSQQALLFY